jgi:hypothetical protein
MTREEILAEIYMVKRVCRGLPLFDQATRDTLTSQLSACHTDAQRGVLVGQMAILLGVPSLPVAHDWASVQTLIYSFQENCGQDFNPIISSYAFDGQSHDVLCPSCGAPQHFQSPLAG